MDMRTFECTVSPKKWILNNVQSYGQNYQIHLDLQRNSLWDTYGDQIEEYCIQMPLIENHVPYKNICYRQCNGITEYNVTDQPSTTTPTCLQNANDTQCYSDINEENISKATIIIFTFKIWQTAKQIYNNIDVN